MITELFLKGRLRHDLAAAEKQALEGAIDRDVTVGPRETFIEAGTRLDRSYYLIEGSMVRHIDGPRGDRQVVQISISGDFIDLHGYPTKRLDHSISSVEPCRLAEISHRDLTSLLQDHWHLARAMWFSTLLDAAMHRAWIDAMGRLPAEGRIAHLLAELVERLGFVDRFDGKAFPIPLLQRDWGDACGITDVHTNRCFRTLQERGLLTVHGAGRIEIHDIAGIRRLAEFTGDYLYGNGSLEIDTLDDG